MSIVGRATTYRGVIEKAMQLVDDTVALEVPALTQAWDGNGVQYAVDQRVRYGDTLYRVIQAHTSQTDWAPDTAVSLFANVLIPSADTIPEWEQPDSTNPYMKGDKVMFEGKVYESLIDNNVWSPSAYPAGWKEVS